MKKFIMVGNTHFDPVWLWRWDEALSSITATLRQALKLMDDYEDFYYSFSAPAVFEWIKNTDMDLFDQIKKRIDEGRWELCEGWWLQADCNGASGESYVRQGLYAQKYFVENFNKKSETVFNIDSFGHPKTLPQIMAGCGIKNYVFWRPNEEHKSLPSPVFNWIGDNNTSIKTYRIGGVGGEIFTADIMQDTLTPLIENIDNTQNDLMVVYGVTDHGGAPTREMIDKIKLAQNDYKDKIDIHMGRCDEYFENIDEKAIPQINDEILVKFLGSSSNITEIKKNNRLAEYSTQNAEAISVISQKLINRPYPKQKINGCWEDIMFNQFHDILGGTCIEDAYFDARNLHGRALQTSSEILHFGLQAVTNKIKMLGKNPDNEWNLVLWNLNGFPIDTFVEAEVQWAWEFDWYRDGIELIDETGKKIECQVIDEQCVVPGFRTRFVFRAKVPSMGYRTYIVKKTNQKINKIENDNKLIENDNYKINYNENGIVNLTDKKSGKSIIDKLLIPYAVGDICDTWGFNKMVYEDEKEFMTLSDIKITENGKVRTTLRLVWDYNKSTVEQKISLYEDMVDCSYRVVWNEEGKALKFMANISSDIKECVASNPYGEVIREKSEYEKPISEYIILKGDENKVTYSFDSIFAYNYDGDNINLTILRNCIYGDLRTEDLDPKRDYLYMGKGLVTGKIRITFDDNSSNNATVLNNPPIVMCEANHDGIFPSTDSFFSVDADNIKLSAMKKAEDDEGIILRVYDTKNKPTTAKANLFDVNFEVLNNPNEIKTLKVINSKMIECNMLEEEI